MEGALITESLRIGTSLEDRKLTVSANSRYRAHGTALDDGARTQQQEAGCLLTPF